MNNLVWVLFFSFVSSIGSAQSELAKPKPNAPTTQPGHLAGDDWIKSKCKARNKLGQLGFVPESHGVANRNQCLYFQAYMIVSVMVNTTGPVLQGQVGEIIDQTGGGQIICAYRVKKGKSVPNAVLNLIKNPPKDLLEMPLREEFMSLVDFECLMS